MEKWADYIIVGVNYNKEPRHINKVEIYDDTGTNVSNLRRLPREDIVRFLKSYKKIITAYKNKEGKLKKGDKVEIFVVRDKEYIKTEGNNKEEDNLGDLPEF
ncbi:MAG: DUF3892 domain-containing protein [archaeon]